MDITTINNIWRPVYGELMKGLRLLTPEWQNVGRLRNFTQLSLRSINWPVQLVYGGGIAFTSDGGSLARASTNEPPEATDTWTYMVGRFEVGFDAITSENAGRFTAQQIEKQIKFQAADKLSSIQRAVAVGFYGYPDAIMFHVTDGSVTNPSGTVVRLPLDSLYGEAGALSARTRIRDYLTINKDYVNVHTAETTATRNATPALVVDIDETNNTIDVDNGTDFSGSVAENDAIVLANQVQTGAADDLNLGLNGLLHLTRAATVHGIATASFPDWAPAVDESSYAQAINGQDLYDWFQTIDQRSGHPVKWAYSTVPALAVAGGAELDQRRYGRDDDTMKLGFKEINSMGVMLQGRPFVPPGHLFLGSDTALRKIAPDEDVRDVVEMGERAGGFQQYENQLGFYKDQIIRQQLAVVSRLGLGVVSGVSES